MTTYDDSLRAFHRRVELDARSARFRKRMAWAAAGFLAVCVALYLKVVK